MIVWIGNTPIDVMQTLAAIYIIGQPAIWIVFLLSIRYGNSQRDTAEEKVRVLEVLISSWVWPLIVAYFILDIILKLTLDKVVNAFKKRLAK